MKTRQTEQANLYIIIDLIILNTAILLTGWLNLDVCPINNNEINLYILHSSLSLVISGFIFSKSNILLFYCSKNHIYYILRHAFIFLIVAVTVAYVLISESFSHRFFAGYFALFYAGKLAFSLILFRYLNYKRRKGKNTSRVLIIGINSTTRFLKKLIESNPVWGYKFVGFASISENEGSEALGDASDLEVLIEKYNIHKVFVSTSLFSNGVNLKNYMDICNSRAVSFRFVPEDQRSFGSKAKNDVANLVIFNPGENPLDHLSNRLKKRLFDIVFASAVTILLLTWLIPIMALLIKLDSRGPVFFLQRRTGINNKIFNCIKFRSMRSNLVSEIMQATANDSRITRIGLFMRDYFIDELPQFLNVLTGDMSVVGPRPHMLKHTEIYQQQIKNYQVRHFSKPGITGWAQVSGYCGETDELWKMERRVDFDIEYNENWTFLLDLKIICLTLLPKRNTVAVNACPLLNDQTIHRQVNHRIAAILTFFRRAV